MASIAYLACDGDRALVACLRLGDPGPGGGRAVRGCRVRWPRGGDCLSRDESRARLRTRRAGFIDAPLLGVQLREIGVNDALHLAIADFAGDGEGRLEKCSCLLDIAALGLQKSEASEDHALLAVVTDVARQG